MNSSELIDRKYYSLYIGNLSKEIRQRDLIDYLARFDQVDRIQLFEANYRRWSTFALVLMRTPASINRIMATRPHFLHERRLSLKRALPDQCSNRIEHLMTSENVLIRFENEQIDPTNFNEENIRNYFQTYGTILNLYLLKKNRCVIEFQDYDSVDCVLLDSPHSFNGEKLRIDKYYSADRLKTIERMSFQHQRSPDRSVRNDDEEANEHFRHSRRYLQMRIRLLRDSTLSIKISNEIKLETIEKGFLATIRRRKELLERIQQLNEQCRIFRDKNEQLSQLVRERFDENDQLAKSYRDDLHRILEEQNLCREKLQRGDVEP